MPAKIGHDRFKLIWLKKSQYRFRLQKKHTRNRLNQEQICFRLIFRVCAKLAAVCHGLGEKSRNLLISNLMTKSLGQSPPCVVAQPTSGKIINPMLATTRHRTPITSRFFRMNELTEVNPHLDAYNFSR